MYFSGQHGTLQVAGKNGNFKDLCAIRNWSYTTQQQVLETTSLEATDRTLINGVRSTSGQASIFYYEEATSNVGDIAKHLIKPSGRDDPDACSFGENDAPELVRLRLSLKGGTGSASRAVTMYAYITSFAMTCSVGEVVSADISFEAHGAPVEWDY